MYTHSGFRLSVLLLLVLGLVTGAHSQTPTTRPVSTDSPPVAGARGLDVVVALDTSGSMTRDTPPFSGRTDFGPRLLREGLEGNPVIPATDNSYLSFEATNILARWLGIFAANQRQRFSDFDIRMSVVTFDNRARSDVDWVFLEDTPPGASDSINLSPPARSDSTEQFHSDFINLFNTVNNLFDRLPETTRQRRVIIITDSIPCNPASEITRVDGLQVRDNSCATPATARNHISTLENQLPAGVSVTLIHLLPRAETGSVASLTSESYWLYHEGVRAAWESLIGEENLYTISDLELMLAPMIESILQGTAGVLLPANLTPTERNAALSIYHPQPGQTDFQHPPYQIQTTLLAALAGDTPRIDLVQNNSSVNYSVEDDFFASDNRNFQMIQYNNLAPADYELVAESAESEIWLSFTPARAAITIEPARLIRYLPLTLRYQLLDDNDTPLALSAEYLPEVTVRVDGADQTTIPLSRSGFNLSGTFFPQEIGQYTFDFDVTAPQQAGLEQISTDFLKPMESGFVRSIDDVSIRPAYRSSTEEVGLTRIPGQLAISRSQDLVVELRLSTESGRTPLPVPDNFSAEIVFQASMSDLDNACPTSEPDFITPADDPDLLRAVVSFDTPGECVIAARLIARNPTTNEPYNVYEPDELVRVTVRPTDIVGWRFIARDNTLMMDNPVPAYRLERPQLSLEQLPRFWEILDRIPETNIPVRLVNLDMPSEPLTIEEVFDQTDSSIAVTPDDNTAYSTDGLFSYSLTRQGESGTGVNEAGQPRRDIQLRPSSEPGVYVLSLAGLPTGTYSLSLRLQTDVYQIDTENYEFRPAFAETPVLRATIEVVPNAAWQFILFGTGLLAVTIIGLLSLRQWQWNQATRNPIQGSIQLLVFDQNDIQELRHFRETMQQPDGWLERHIAWQQTGSDTYNQQQFSEDELLTGQLLESDIRTLTLNTKELGDSPGSVHVTIGARQKLLFDAILNPGEIRRFDTFAPTDSNQRKYFFIVRLYQQDDLGIDSVLRADDIESLLFTDADAETIDDDNIEGSS